MNMEFKSPRVTRPFVLVLLGPPGSGKGTQGKRLAKELDAVHLATGDLVKELANRQSGSETVKAVKERFERGIPQPDEIILRLVREKIAELDYQRGLIFDAFPLSLAQADGLAALVKDYSLREPLVIYFDLSLAEAVKRLTHRKFCPVDNLSFRLDDAAYEAGFCDRCQGALIKRADDKPEIAKHRYEAYAERNRLIKDYYQTKGRLVVVDAAQAIDQVHRDILTAIGH